MKPILITTVITGLLLGCCTQKSEGPAIEEPRMQRQISDEELQAISDLHLAAEEGDLAKVKQCLKKGTNIDCVAGRLDSALAKVRPTHITVPSHHVSHTSDLGP